jgi:hypothetical protein
VPLRIGFPPNWDAPIDVGEEEAAAQAWQKVCNLQRSDEVIRTIAYSRCELKELAGKRKHLTVGPR